MVKTIFEALKYGSDILNKNNIESFSLDAKILLSYILKCDKNYLLVHKNDSISEEDYLKYIELIEKRANKMPVKYLTGICEFYSLDFIVNENVLIPRPDTEIIIDKVTKEEKDKKKNLKILDLCTGSGCIGITLATLFKESEVTLVDISEGALDVANKNIIKHKVLERVKTLKKDILTENITGEFDIIVSNPPYINDDDFLLLEDDVKNYEPEIALISPLDEYKFYKRIIDVYSNNLKDGGIMLLEMGYNQSEFLYNYAVKNNLFKSVETAKDFSGIERVLCIKK